MERRIVAQLLTSLDDLASAETEGRPIVIIGATNRPGKQPVLNIERPDLFLDVLHQNVMYVLQPLFILFFVALNIALCRPWAELYDIRSTLILHCACIRDRQERCSALRRFNHFQWNLRLFSSLPSFRTRDNPSLTSSDALDPALRRSGRFDREIALPVPDQRVSIKDISSLCSSSVAGTRTHPEGTLQRASTGGRL
jgi:hypothetical protein